MKLIAEGKFTTEQRGEPITFNGKFLTATNSKKNITFDILNTCHWYEYYPKGFEEGADLPSVTQIIPSYEDLNNLHATIEVDFNGTSAKCITIIHRNLTAEQAQAKVKEAKENLYNIMKGTMKEE